MNCVHCGILLDGASFPTHIEDTGEMIYVCSTCLREHYRLCVACGKAYSNTYPFPASNLCPLCHNNTHVQCEDCGTVFLRDEEEIVHLNQWNGESRTVCQGCANDNYYCCDICERDVYQDESHFDDDTEQTMCPHCWDRRDTCDECESDDDCDDDDSEDNRCEAVEGTPQQISAAGVIADAIEAMGTIPQVSTLDGLRAEIDAGLSGPIYTQTVRYDTAPSPWEAIPNPVPEPMQPAPERMARDIFEPSPHYYRGTGRASEEEHIEDSNRSMRPTKLEVKTPTFNECISHLTYGVEIETSAFTRNTGKDSGKGCYWANVRDGSLKETGTEFLSPVLIADQGFAELKKFLTEDITAIIDDKCGFHVHIGFPQDISYMNIAKIIKTYQSLEKYFYMMVKPDRIHSKYCKPLPTFWKYFVLTKEKDLTSALYIKDSFDIIERISTGKTGPDYIPKYVNARYSWLNIHTFFIRKTLEIRSYEGTLNYEEMTDWINLHTILMEYITKTKSSALFKAVKAVTDIDSFIDFVHRVFLEMGMKDTQAIRICDYYAGKMKKNSSAITKAVSKGESKMLVPINF